MITMRRSFHIFCLTVLLSICSTVNAQEHIPLLVIVDTSTELSVDYRSGGKLARNLLLLGSILDVAIDQSTKSKHSQILQKAVGVHDRNPIITKSVVGAFSIQPYFKITIAPSNNGYGTVKKPLIGKIGSAGFLHVLTVEEESSGLITAWKMSTLSATTRLSYKLIDTGSDKILAKDRINGFARPQYTFEEATTNPDLFFQDYPQAVTAAASRIVGDLRKNGLLHQIAKQYGLGDKVPDTASILRQYERRFSYKFKNPKGWKTFDMQTKYVTVLAPVKDKDHYGLNISFDLLLEAFGQKVDTVEAYALIILKRLQDLGFKVIPDKFPGFELNDDFQQYTIEKKATGAIHIKLFKQLDENFIVIYTVVITKRFDELFAKHKAGVEAIINTARIKTK